MQDLLSIRREKFRNTKVREEREKIFAQKRIIQPSEENIVSPHQFHKIFNEDIEVQRQGLVSIRQFVSSSDNILENVQHLLGETQLIQRLLDLIKVDQNENILVETIWVLTNIFFTNIEDSLFIRQCLSKVLVLHQRRMDSELLDSFLWCCCNMIKSLVDLNNDDYQDNKLDFRFFYEFEFLEDQILGQNSIDNYITLLSLIMRNQLNLYDIKRSQWIRILLRLNQFCKDEDTQERILEQLCFTTEKGFSEQQNIITIDELVKLFVELVNSKGHKQSLVLEVLENLLRNDIYDITNFSEIVLVTLYDAFKQLESQIEMPTQMMYILNKLTSQQNCLELMVQDNYTWFLLQQSLESQDQLKEEYAINIYLSILETQKIGSDLSLQLLKTLTQKIKDNAFKDKRLRKSLYIINILLYNDLFLQYFECLGGDIIIDELQGHKDQKIQKIAQKIHSEFYDQI